MLVPLKMSFDFTDELDLYSLKQNDDPLDRNISEEYYHNLHKAVRQEYITSLREPFTPATPPAVSTPERIKRILRGQQNFVQRRLNLMKKVVSNLQQINVTQGRMCFRNPIFYGKFTSMLLIGSGTFGQVYLSQLDKHRVIIKEAVLTSEDSPLALYKGGQDIPSQYWTVEYSIAKRLNDLVISKRCPNFMLTYDLGLCLKCRSDFKESVCSMTFMEPASFDLAFAFKERVLGPASQLSLLSQLLIALHYVQETFQIFHSDIKAQNILILETPNLSKTLFKYKIKDDPHSIRDTFLVENAGLVLCLSDFGVADRIGPHSTFEYSVQDGKLKPSTNKTGIPSEYGNDILDCVRTFLGTHSWMNKRTSQPGAHKGYSLLSSQLMDVLKQINDGLPANLTSSKVNLKPDQAYLLDPIICLRKILDDLKYVAPVLPVSNTFGC